MNVIGPHRTFRQPWSCCTAARRSRHSPQTHGLDIEGSQECGRYSSHSPQALDQCRACEAIQRTDRRGPDGGAAWQPLNQSVAAARCPCRKGSIRLSARGEKTFVAAGAPDLETEATEVLVEVSERSYIRQTVDLFAAHWWVVGRSVHQAYGHAMWTQLRLSSWKIFVTHARLPICNG